MPALYAIMLVVLAIWAGLFLYLWRLDQRIREVQRALAARPGLASPEAPAAVLEPGPEGREEG